MPSFLPELKRTARAALAVVALAISALPAAQAAAVTGQGTWQTTLQARDLDGNGSTDAYYDTALNITWLADAGAFRGSWDASKDWADNLVVGAYSDWRLPTMVDVGNNGCATFSTAGGANTDCGYNVDTGLSEMAHVYYVTLGNKGYHAPGTGASNQPGWGLSNTGPFSNVQSYLYWSGVEYAPGTNRAWYFYTGYGDQDDYPKDVALYAWAVRPGDVAAVPEPQAYLLALAGLAVAGALARKRRA
jgi:PEP-CTERM motif